MKFRFGNAATAALFYVMALVMLSQFGAGAILAFGLYAAACMLITRHMIASAKARQVGNKIIEFSQHNATSVFGEQWSSFHHVFESREPVIEKFHTQLTHSLRTKLSCADIKEAQFRDHDPDLPQPETRTFYVTSAPPTVRKTSFFLLCTYYRTGDIQGIRWWVFVEGQYNPNKVFWRYALAPLQLPFVLLAYFRRQYEPLHGLTAIGPGFFNALDMLFRARQLEFVAFETLVETLNSFGIDTSDLKAQRANVLNVNVSGAGRASFGSILQGAANSVRHASGAQP